MTHDPHAVVFNLLSEDFQHDPAATFAELRGRCPVNHNRYRTWLPKRRSFHSTFARSWWS